MTWSRALVCPPVGPHPIEVVDLDLFTAVAPVEVLVGPERRRALQFLFSQIELIGTERPLVVEPCPWNRQVLPSDPEKAAKAKHRVGNIAAMLVYHQALDRSELAAV